MSGNRSADHRKKTSFDNGFLDWTKHPEKSDADWKGGYKPDRE